jgi:hypothetical protein
MPLAENETAPGVRGDSGEAERLFRMRVERHSGMNPSIHRSTSSAGKTIARRVGFTE